MKAKEIINEVDWRRLGNIGIKAGDALMGVSGTKGFDVGKGIATQSANKLTQAFQKELINDVQTASDGAYRRGHPLSESDLRAVVKNAIEDHLKVDPASYTIREQVQSLIAIVVKEHGNSNSTLKTNKNLTKAIFQLAVAVLRSKIGNKQKELRAYISVEGNSTYFRIQGNARTWYKYTLVPNTDPREFVNPIEVSDNLKSRSLRSNEDLVAIIDVSTRENSRDRIQVQE